MKLIRSKKAVLIILLSLVAASFFGVTFASLIEEGHNTLKLAVAGVGGKFGVLLLEYLLIKFKIGLV